MTTPPSGFPQSRTALDGRVYVALTYDELDLADAVARVKSPGAGAVVMFAGTTRDTFANKRVSHLSYSAYAPRALTTMTSICRDILLGSSAPSEPIPTPSPSTTASTNTTTKTTTPSPSPSAPQTPLPSGLVAITMTHRLGTVPIGAESIIITVSAAHRAEAWRAGEEALERCKEKVEVWKEEWFEDESEGVWRANRDGGVGVRVG